MAHCRCLYQSKSERGGEGGPIYRENHYNRETETISAERVPRPQKEMMEGDF